MSVIDHTGKTICERPWQRNLLLDQGVNKLAETSICDLFAYAAKGTGTTATREIMHASSDYALTGTTLVRSGGSARDFEAGDVGRLVKIVGGAGTEGIITGFIDADTVTLRAVGQTSLANYSAENIVLYYVEQTGLDTESGARTNTYGSATGANGTSDASNVRTLTRTFIFDAQAEDEEDVADTNTYSRAGTTVTHVDGTRQFTSLDEGKYIWFDTDEVLTKITTFLSSSQVTVADSGTIAAQTIKFYGFTEYGEIGFSHTATAASNLNIRVRLEDGAGASDPVVVEGANPVSPGQQLKVVYEMEVTVTPNASTGATAQITDSGNQMSSNKAGDYVIEQLALSFVADDGDTDTSFAALEPSVAGNAGISSSFAALVPLNGPDRSSGADYTALVADDYVADSFTRLYEGTFGINDAIATNWRSIGLCDAVSDAFVFTFVFDAAQTKDGDHSLTLRFRKTWNRDLS